MSAVEGFRSFHLPYDRRILDEVHGQFVNHPRAHDLIINIDDGQAIFVGVALLAVFMLALARPRTRPAVVATLAGVALAYGATVILKPIVDRGKPYLTGRLAAGQHPGAVFPEGPGAIWVALGVGLWGTSRPLSLIAFAFAIEDGLVQLLRGSHWPSDLYAAWLLGLAGGLLCQAALRRFNRPGSASLDS
jgi:membrane-associated phospholipid phosphatase